MNFGLLFPGEERPVVTVDASVLEDLSFEKLFELFQCDKQSRPYMESILTQLCLDVETIRYRQDIIEDLLRNDEIVRRFAKVIPLLNKLENYIFSGQYFDDLTIRKVSSRLNELSVYAESVFELHDLFNDPHISIHSIGLNAFRKIINEIAQSDEYQSLKKELPKLINNSFNIKSVSVGINFDGDLTPCEVVLLSINEKKYRENSFLNSLIKTAGGNGGIAGMHKKYKPGFDGDFWRIPENGERYVNKDLRVLFQDVEHILRDVVASTDKSLADFYKVDAGVLFNLKKEILFYLSAVQMIKSVTEKGLPMTKPAVMKKNEKVFRVTGLYNLNLFEKFRNEHSVSDLIVKNDVHLSKEQGIAILTGPNSGGKTTFIESLGIIQIFAQTGLFVPAIESQISVVDGIYSHYQDKESNTKESGRLGQESGEISVIFDKATEFSFILMNESFASTSEADSHYILRDILQVMRMIGMKSVLVTHLHSLANQIGDMNREVKGRTDIISLVASINRKLDAHERPVMVPTFRITESEPLGKSFAREVADCYGISFDQLKRKSVERKLMEIM